MPFIRKVHVLFKTRLIFSRINGPNVTICFPVEIPYWWRWCFWSAENLLYPVRSTPQILVVIHHQYGISSHSSDIGCLPFTKRFWKTQSESKWNAIFLGRSSRTFPEAMKHLKHILNGICVPFPQFIFDTSFRPPQPFFGECYWFGQMVNAVPRGQFPFLNFAYHLPKLWFDRFAHLNGEKVNVDLKITKQQREKRLEVSRYFGRTSRPSSGDLMKNRKVVNIQIL